MIFVVIFCELRWACVSSIVASIMMLVKAATALEITMDIFFIDAFDKLFLLLIELLQPIRVLGRKTELLEFVQVFDRALVSLLDVACLDQVDEELFDEVDRRRLRE